MKARTFAVITVLGVIAASCIPSLYPLYQNKDLLTDPDLEGIFYSDDDDYWEISLLDPQWEKRFSDYWNTYTTGKTYKLTVREDQLVQDFALHLLKLGEYYYLDFFPVHYEIRHKLLKEELFPAHIFARAEISKQNLVIHYFDNDWLDDVFDKQHIRLSHTELHDRYLLTAKTEELQKFILKYANDSTTFIEADTLLRKPVLTGFNPERGAGPPADFRQLLFNVL